MSGLEAAAFLVSHAASVTVVGRAPFLLGRVLGEEVGKAVKKVEQKINTIVHESSRVISIMEADVLQMKPSQFKICLLKADPTAELIRLIIGGRTT